MGCCSRRRVLGAKRERTVDDDVVDTEGDLRKGMDLESGDGAYLSRVFFWPPSKGFCFKEVEGLLFCHVIECI